MGPNHLTDLCLKFQTLEWPGVGAGPDHLLGGPKVERDIDQEVIGAGQVFGGGEEQSRVTILPEMPVKPTEAATPTLM